MNHSLVVLHLGTFEYASSLALQRELAQQRLEGQIPDHLLLLEHPPVYTLGSAGRKEHLLFPEEFFRQKGADIFYIGRGGDVTFHGPGQLVGYPILDLRYYNKDVHQYVRRLEETILRTLKEYGVWAERKPGLPGVWVGEDKIAALGIEVRKWITRHGFAFNISTDLSYFQWIIPCGIPDKGVTSLKALRGEAPPMEEVSQKIVKHFVSLFGYTEVQERFEKGEETLKRLSQ